MKLHLVKPDLIYYEKYNDMMSEWCASKTQIAPWFLDSTIMSIDEFAQFVRMLDDCEHGIVDKNFSATSSYFVMDENDRLIGAISLRHYLTVEGFLSWGHIGYGVRPTERQKGYAVQIKGKHNRFQSQPCASKRGLAAGVSRADYGNIVLSFDKCVHFYNIIARNQIGQFSISLK